MIFELQLVKQWEYWFPQLLWGFPAGLHRSSFSFWLNFLRSASSFPQLQTLAGRPNKGRNRCDSGEFPWKCETGEACFHLSEAHNMSVEIGSPSRIKDHLSKLSKHLDCSCPVWPLLSHRVGHWIYLWHWPRCSQRWCICLPWKGKGMKSDPKTVRVATAHALKMW